MNKTPSYLTVLAFVASFVPSVTDAQITRSNLYCCSNDAGQKVCADRRDHCWGRETTVTNAKGMVVERIATPLTRSERVALAKAKEVKLEEDKQAKLRELNFKSLLASYGSPEAIDREIIRQEKESEANIRITESKLQNAKNNVEVCKDKLSRNEVTAFCNSDLLEDYKQTVIDIEKEVQSRHEQNNSVKQNLLETKSKIVKYSQEKEGGFVEPAKVAPTTKKTNNIVEFAKEKSGVVADFAKKKAGAVADYAKEKVGIK